MARTIEVEDLGGARAVSVVALDGELDASNYERLIEVVRDAYTRGTRGLVLDLSKLSFMASSGLFALHSAFRIMRDAANLQPGLRINPDTPLGSRPLGIRGEDVKLDGDAGGVKVGFVAADGALGKGGVELNDVIVTFRGKPLSGSRPMADLWMRAQQSRGEGECEVEVLRGGAKKTLTVAWAR
jgi:anti-anti-sigma factor